MYCFVNYSSKIWDKNTLNFNMGIVAELGWFIWSGRGACSLDLAINKSESQHQWISRWLKHWIMNWVNFICNAFQINTMQANKSSNFFHQKMSQSLFSENKSYLSRRRQLLTSLAVFLDYRCFSVRNFKVSKVKACKQSKAKNLPLVSSLLNFLYWLIVFVTFS